MKYNPKLNEWAARLPGFAGLHPMAPDAVAQGTLELLFELEALLAEISGMDAVTLQPAAGAHGELTGILMIRAYHRSRGDARADRGAGARLVARHQPGDGDDGRLPDDHDPVGVRRRRRPRRVPRGARAQDRGDHDHQPLDPRAVRAPDRRAARRHARGRGAGLHGRRQPQRDPRAVQARRGRLRRHALQHPQDVQHAARRRRPGRRARSACVRRWCRSCPRRASSSAPTTARSASRPRASDPRPSAGCARSSAARASSCARTRTSVPTAPTGCARCRDDAVLAANYLKARVGDGVPDPVRPGLQARVRRLRGGPQAPNRRAHPRRREAVDRQGLPSADDLLPAHGRGRHAHRAHRDGVARDARRASRTRSSRSPARRRPIPSSSRRPRTTRRSGASTRRPPPASRTSAGAA